ncbi:MAG: hypothetical protein ABSG15_10710 [FCB group bacterium]
MVYAILIWIYVFLLTITYGLITQKLIYKLFNFEIFPETPSFFIIILLGFCTITTLLSYLSLFIPVGFWVNIILLAIALIYIIFNLTEIRNLLLNSLTLASYFSISMKIILLIIILAGLFFTVLSPYNFDTYLYHVQSVRWLETYKVVPGLGNLHGKLAFNNSWFVTSAFFSFSFIGGTSFHVLTEFLLITSSIHFSVGLQKILTKNFAKQNLFEALFLPTLLITYLLINPIASVTPDFPVILLIWITFILFLKNRWNGEPYKFDLNSVIIIILSCFAITVKLSALPCVFFIFYFFVLELYYKRYRNIIFILLISIFIISPWLIRNVIISGYLIYPFPYIDLFNFDWKIPIQSVIYEKNNTYADSIHPLLGVSTVLKMSLLEKFSHWWICLSVIFRIIFIILLITILNLFKQFIYFLRGNKKYYINKLFTIATLVCLSGIIYWVVNAPSIRLGMSFITLIFIFSFFPEFNNLFTKLSKYKITLKFKLILFLSILVFSSVFLFFRIHKDEKASREGFEKIGEILKDYKKIIISPYGYDEFPIVKVKYNNIDIYLPVVDDTRTGYSHFPSTAKIQENLSLRGNSLEDGFRISKIK